MAKVFINRPVWSAILASWAQCHHGVNVELLTIFFFSIDYASTTKGCEGTFQTNIDTNCGWYPAHFCVADNCHIYIKHYW